MFMYFPGSLIEGQGYGDGKSGKLPFLLKILPDGPFFTIQVNAKGLPLSTISI